LTAKAFDTLLVLVQHHSRVVEKEELLKLIWPDSIVEERNLAVNISALRKVLGDSPESHEYIVTIPGRGYRFVAPVRENGDMRDANALMPVVESGTAPLSRRRIGRRRRDKHPGKHGRANALAGMGNCGGVTCCARRSVVGSFP
jgi:hypothetical protein